MRSIKLTNKDSILSLSL